MHPGWAAHSGIKAAEIAQAGITGPDKPFDDAFGLFRVFAGAPEASARFAAHVANLGDRWHLPEVAFKFLPCCHYIHPFVEAASQISKDGLHPDDITRLRFFVPQGAASIICEPWAEKCRAAGHAARWSLPVVTATQLVQGHVDLDSFEAKTTAGIHALAARSVWEPLVDSRFPDRFDGALEIDLRSGATRRLRIDDVYGNASRPPSEKAIRDKFHSNVKGLMDDESAARLGDALKGIHALPNLRNLSEMLRSISAKETNNEL
jgi:2-methylcitrate dehydratase PrpD